MQTTPGWHMALDLSRVREAERGDLPTICFRQTPGSLGTSVHPPVTLQTWL